MENIDPPTELVIKHVFIQKYTNHITAATMMRIFPKIFIEKKRSILGRNLN